jgi:RNA polymerase sigma-70 factor (ECF subfamily)
MRDDDDDLLARTASEPEAFGAFYRRYERAVLAYFMRRTRDPEIAADLCAETFAAALLASGRYRPSGEPATAWLFGIARHKLLRSLERRRLEDGARRRLSIEPVVLPDEAREAIERLDEDARVRELLAGLPAEQAQAVETRVLHGLSYEAMAERGGSSPAAVRKRVSRGLAALRASILKEQS